MLSTEALLKIGKELGLPVSRVETAVRLLESGATVPFVARYRKDATGNLDELQIRDIDFLRMHYRALADRRTAVLAAIEKQGKLSDALKSAIEACFDKNELDDLYLPYKPRRRTRAGTADERG